MRSILALAVLCSTGALLLPGCANNLESPFKMAKREIRESVVIELGAKDKLKVNNSSEDPNAIGEVLGEIGSKQPGRKVTLIMDDDADPRAVPHIKSAASRAGLGEVTVLKRSELDAKRKVDQTPPPAAEPPSAPAPAPNPDSVPLPPAQPLAASPETAAVPMVAAVPASRAYNPDVVTIEVSHDNDFKVNGQAVPFEQFPAVVKKIGAENPGKKVEVYREKGSTEGVIFFVYKECKEAGLGELTAK